MIEIQDDIVDFFRERAVSHADLQNDANDNAFVMLDNDDAVVGELSLKKEIFMALVVDSRLGGYVGSVERPDNGGLIETLQNEIMVVKTVPEGDYQAYVDAIAQCKRVCFDVIIYMHSQMGRCFKFYNLRHYRVGPVFQSRHGWAFKFDREKNIPFVRTLDTDIWVNEPAP